MKPFRVMLVACLPMLLGMQIAGHAHSAAQVESNESQTTPGPSLEGLDLQVPLIQPDRTPQINPGHRTPALINPSVRTPRLEVPDLRRQLFPRGMRRNQQEYWSRFFRDSEGQINLQVRDFGSIRGPAFHDIPRTPDRVPTVWGICSTPSGVSCPLATYLPSGRPCWCGNVQGVTL